MSSIGSWFRPPRHIVPLFVTVTLLPSLMLVVFGWRLLRQDEELARQEVESRREQTVDLIVASVEGAVAATEAALRRPASLSSVPTTPDSVVVVFDGDGMTEIPGDRLAYVPMPRRGRSAPPGLFSRGDELEHREKNSQLAAEYYRRLSASHDEAVRAAALHGYGRNLRKIGAHEEALVVYRTMADVRGVSVDGLPADLLARSALCSLLGALDRAEELRTEASATRSLLLAGHWRLDRATFELNLQQLNEWAGDVRQPFRDAVALAAIVDQLWTEWRSRRAMEARRSHAVDGEVFTVLATVDSTPRTALIAGPSFASGHWLSRVQPLHPEDSVRIEARDAALSQPGVSPRVTRRAVQTGLPWTLIVDPGIARLGDAAGRRTLLWLSGLAILVAVVAGGTYVIARAVSRELAVARLQSDFVAAVSHEFRTPLTSLRQLSEMLLDRPHPPDRARTYYEALQRQTERLHRLVESLLDFGRMEAGRSPYELVPASAAALVERVVNEFRADAAARDHVVELIVTSDAVVDVDQGALANALWNVLDNATKYSPGHDRIRVSVASDAAELVIAVTDDGFGIPPREQRDVFRKFVRGSRARAEGIRGTGLGLAMVHHIVAAHHGRVVLDSEPGRGTTLSVRLPVSAAASVGKVEACLES